MTRRVCHMVLRFRRRTQVILIGCILYLLYISTSSFVYMHVDPVVIHESQLDNKVDHKVEPVPKINNDFTALPSITLTIRSTSNGGLLNLMYCIALRSLTLYWSKHLGDIGIILDNESARDHKWAASLLKHQESMGMNFKFYFEPLPKDPSIFVKVARRTPGYNRQIYSSFFTDQFIETDVVAWTDTDGKFTVPVAPENILHGGKLPVKGMSTFQYTVGWSAQTKVMIGHEMISDFMTYFPVLIWRDTITSCRKHILKHMNATDMEVAFLMTKPGGDISPVNVIMTYAFYFERDRYDWHIDIKGHDLVAYNAKHATPGLGVGPADLSPEVHVSVHHKYYNERVNVNHKSYCFAIKNSDIKVEDQIKKQCEKFQNDTMLELFQFVDWGPRVQQEHVTTWCKDDMNLCVQLINHQYELVRDMVKQGIYDLDLNRVHAVEAAAKDMQVSCPIYF